MYHFKAKSKGPFRSGAALVGVDRHEALKLLGIGQVRLRRTIFIGDETDACVMIPQALSAVDLGGVLSLQGTARCSGQELDIWLLVDHHVLELIQAREEMGERKVVLDLPRTVTWKMMDRREGAACPG